MDLRPQQQRHHANLLLEDGSQQSQRSLTINMLLIAYTAPREHPKTYVNNCISLSRPPGGLYDESQMHAPMAVRCQPTCFMSHVLHESIQQTKLLLAYHVLTLH